MTKHAKHAQHARSGKGGKPASPRKRPTRAGRPAPARPRAGPAPKAARSAPRGPVETHERAHPPEPPATPAELARWLREQVGVVMPESGVLEGSSSAWRYVLWSYFEGRVPEPGAGSGPSGQGAGGGEGVAEESAPPADAVVWANRGGGKTFAGAVATMLDLVFKPGIEVRVLAGSLEQSRRMHEHLTGFFAPRPDGGGLSWMVAGGGGAGGGPGAGGVEAVAGVGAGVGTRRGAAITARRLVLRNGSRCEVLAASHTSVRGVRVQKLRCDEVDLFDRELWEAAQLTVRSMPLAGPWGPVVRGSVDALSTMHVPHGLMWEVVGRAEPEGRPAPGVGGATRRLFRWGVIDTLEVCPPRRACEGCGLWAWCRGRAKATPGQEPPRAGGHLRIDDALRARARVSTAAWESEMLCQRPSRGASVLPEFDARTHLFGSEAVGPGGAALAELPAGGRWVAGLDFGLRSPLVWLWAHLDRGGVLRVADEHVLTDVRLEDHVALIRERARLMGWPEPEWVGADPAGRARSEQTGLSAVAVLRRLGLVVRTARASLSDGLELVRRRLEGRGGPGAGGVEVAGDHDGLEGDDDAIAELAPRGPASPGNPRLLIHARCRRLIESLQRYRYPPDRPETLEPLKDGNDHACDALRYLVLNLDAGSRSRRGRYA